MLEDYVIRHCAPTLGRLKTGNLFRVPAGYDVDTELRQLNEKLNSRGVRLTVLRRDARGSMIYVYRPLQLERDLQCPLRRRFLEAHGYGRMEPEACLAHLRTRVAQDEFPHEIGLFLGYPLADVEGFIAHCGRDCLACGQWKAYSCPEMAQAQWNKFNKCSSIYRRLYGEGVPITRLTVAA